MIIKCLDDSRYGEKYPNYNAAELELSDTLDGDSELSVTIEEDGEINTVYLDKQHACKIIDHLIEVFDLQPSDIGV